MIIFNPYKSVFLELLKGNAWSFVLNKPEKHLSNIWSVTILDIDKKEIFTYSFLERFKRSWHKEFILTIAASTIYQIINK